MKSPTREQWLALVVEHFRPDFTFNCRPLPKVVRVSTGWPKGGRGAATIGQCWYAETTGDKNPQVFISPILKDSARVVDVLVHELVHASGIKGHKQDFRAVATAMGLTGKMTETVASPAFTVRARRLIKKIGEYPHAVINLEDGPKKQTTRMIKLNCPEKECGYVVRTTRKWAAIGLPTCPRGTEMVGDE